MPLRMRRQSSLRADSDMNSINFTRLGGDHRNRRAKPNLLSGARGIPVESDKVRGSGWFLAHRRKFSSMAPLPLIVFDVNETLLDLETMEPTFQRIFGDKGAMRLWFANLILYSAALTVAGRYVPFTDIGCGGYEDARGHPWHQNWRQGQERAYGKVLHNAASPRSSGRSAQATRRGLPTFHAHGQSARSSNAPARAWRHCRSLRAAIQCRWREHYKPSPEAYAYVEKDLGVKSSQLCLIACHTWDTLGAVRGGLGGRADQTYRQRYSRGRPSAADHRQRPQRRRRSTHRATQESSGLTRRA